jgi:hypothetical protein
VSLLQRVTALERFLGPVSGACIQCGSPYGTGVVVLREDEEPGECPMCGGTVDHAGRGVEALLRSGATPLGAPIIPRPIFRSIWRLFVGLRG